jgi:hypothetical protein
MLRKLELEDMERAAAVHRVSFDDALPTLEGFARRIPRNVRTMLSKKALTIGFAVEKAGFGFYLAGVFGQVHADGTGCLYHVRSTTNARACTATATIARCDNLV